jgi:hypothetical protein
MRSLASTILNEEGFDPDVIEAALAHMTSAMPTAEPTILSVENQ